MNNRVVVCIPARYGSTRFPAKVLAKIGGKPMVQWVYERASKASADEVLVATDDQRVMEAVKAFGGRAVMTRTEHPSGTDRIWEAVKGLDCGIVINVQGDEPFIEPSAIEQLIDALKSRSDAQMATIVVRTTREQIGANPNMVKAVLDAQGYALYFSRSAVPFLRDGGTECPLHLHWGVYGYRRTALERFVSLREGTLEKCEKLEQLRALENGMRIFCLVRDSKAGPGVDTPEDLVKAEEFLASMKEPR